MEPQHNIGTFLMSHDEQQFVSKKRDKNRVSVGEFCPATQVIKQPCALQGDGLLFVSCS